MGQSRNHGIHGEKKEGVTKGKASLWLVDKNSDERKREASRDKLKEGEDRVGGVGEQKERWAGERGQRYSSYQERTMGND